MKNTTEYTAWMIREDGKAIPCIQHIYGSEDVEETLYASEWLYKNTRKPETQQLIIQFISIYAISLNLAESLEKTLLADVKSKPYVTLTADFVKKVGGELISPFGHLEMLNQKVCDALNDEFKRARYGGKYNTVAGCKEMYFRISSVKPLWSEVITDFLGEVPFSIQDVTVVCDEESTGTGGCCKDDAGDEIDHIPYVPGMVVQMDFAANPNIKETSNG